MFKDLRVVGLGASASYQSTLGSVLNPFNVLEAINAIRHPPIKDILSGFNGVVRPGEMLREFSIIICLWKPLNNLQWCLEAQDPDAVHSSRPWLISEVNITRWRAKSTTTRYRRRISNSITAAM